VDKVLKELQPILTALGAIFSIAVFGFLIRFFMLMRSALNESIKAVKEQKGVLTERLDKAQEDLIRTEKWYEREIAKLREQLASVMKSQDVSAESFIHNRIEKSIKSGLRESLQPILKEMLVLESSALMHDYKIKEPNWYLDVANASMTSHKWLDAAHHYDKYIEFNPRNWEVHFLRGIAYANVGSAEANVEALRAYSEVIALAPADLDRKTRARIHAYRGGILKRLRRLEEAESQLNLALTWANETYEKEDISYNFACVYAMRGQKDKMLQYLRPLLSKQWWRSLLASEMQYFSGYRDDKDFQQLFDV
jgi:tetratricopeptide (TPR) repeat protein